MKHSQTGPVCSPCVVCGFWLETARYQFKAGAPLKRQPCCPNCGVAGPLDHTFWKSYGHGGEGMGLFGRFVAGTLLGWAAMLGVGFLSALLAPILGFVGWSPLWPLIGFLVVFLIYLPLGIANDRRADFRRADCLRQIEASLQADLGVNPELRASAARLEARIAEARREGRDPAALEKALAAVVDAARAEEERAAQVRLVQCRIDMIRWQNQLEPLVLDRAGVRDLTEWQRRIERVRELRSAGEEQRGRLDEDAIMRELPEGRKLLAAWAELLQGGGRLEDELLAQQALCAVEAVQPLHEGLIDRPLAHSALESETALRHVLITHDFGDLEHAVADLRAQQSRIHAEREAAAELVRVGSGGS